MDEETKEFLIEIADYLDSIYGKFDEDNDWSAPDDSFKMARKVREFITRRSGNIPKLDPRQT